MAYDKPLPFITESSRPFWDAARKGRIVLPKCRSCGALRTYFEPWCNRCGHEGADWAPITPTGHIWANCRFHKEYFQGFTLEIPYNVAIVELDDGPRLITNIVGLNRGDLNEMPIGAPVQAVFEPVSDSVTLIKFHLT